MHAIASHRWVTLMTVVILASLLLPGSSVPSVGLSHIDLAAHALLFALWSLALCREAQPVRRHLWLVVPCTAVFGLITEVLQLAASDRSFDFVDVLADAGGGLTAFVVAAAQQRKHQRPAAPVLPERD